MTLKHCRCCSKCLTWGFLCPFCHLHLTKGICTAQTLSTQFLFDTILSLCVFVWLGFDRMRQLSCYSCHIACYSSRMSWHNRHPWLISREAHRHTTTQQFSSSQHHSGKWLYGQWRKPPGIIGRWFHDCRQWVILLVTIYCDSKLICESNFQVKNNSTSTFNGGGFASVQYSESSDGGNNKYMYHCLVDFIIQYKVGH